MRVTFVHLGRENLGIEYLSASLKHQGHNVSLAYDPGLFGINDNVFYIPLLEKIFDRKAYVLEQIQRSHPDVVAFSVYSSTYRWALAIAQEVKQHWGTLTVFGGIHPTLVPQEVITQPQVDYVIVGESDQALSEVLEYLENDKDPGQVANLWHQSGHKIVSNPVRPPIAHLDQLPLPDKSLFKEEINYSDDYLILTARGCPYHCTYCCESYWNRLYRNRYFRRRSVQSVLDELRQMKQRFAFHEVMFNDPIFFTDRVWLRELMNRYQREIRVPFRCFGRADFLDAEIAGLLQEGGCYAIEFGLQSFNQKVRKQILARPETNSQYRQAFQILDEVGIRYDIDHLFGIPGESLRDHIDAARFYKNLKRLNRIKCHNLTYFPGLEIVKKAGKAGLLSNRDLDNIKTGELNSDFFHRDSLHGISLKEISWDFQALFKVLPILPKTGVDMILGRNHYKGWHKVPAFLILLGQILVAVRGRDYRFFLYFRYYLFRMRRSFQLLPRIKELTSCLLYGSAALATIPIGNALKDWGIIHFIGILLTGVALHSLWKLWKS